MPDSASIAPVLRGYQEEALRRLHREWEHGHRSVLLVSPTGSGKTVIAAEIVRRHIEVGGRVLFLVHRDELLGQTEEKLSTLGVFSGFISAKRAEDFRPVAPVQIASVQTLLARPAELPDASLVVFDEAHHYCASTWHQVAARYLSALRVGLTATPVRSDGTGLGNIFSSLIEVASIRELIGQGHLVPCRFHTTTRRNDDEADESEDESEEPVSPPAAVWAKHCRERRTIIFCDSVESAEQVAAEIRSRGGTAACISGETPTDERRAAIADFKAGRLQCLTNHSVLTEGFDCPETDAVILGRKIRFIGQYLQILGRAMRPAPGKKEAVVFDLCGTYWLHGDPAEDREWRLNGLPIRKKKIWRTQCSTCGLMFDPGPRSCPACGAVVSQPIAQQIKIVGGKVIGPDGKQLPPAPETLRKDYQVLLKEASRKGYKPGWAFFRFCERFGSVPPRSWSYTR